MQQPSVPVSDHRTSFDWRSRVRAAGLHLVLSALVAALAALLVFGLWYPYPYRSISGGSDLFRLVVTVDVVLGPLVTFAIFNRRKPRSELRRDLTIVVLLQLAALAYGLWTVHQARPVHMVFEYDRFRVVHLAEIPRELEGRSPAGIEVAPTPPTLLSLRPFRDEREKVEMTMAALSGVHLSARPDLWQSYEAGKGAILAAARPVAELKKRFADRTAEIEAALRESGTPEDRAAYLPLVGRNAEAWTVLLDASTAKVIGFVPLDSF